MLARIRKSAEEKDQGFTLIELLVVMIIIGILAAIAIPVFLNQRTKARETSAKADVTTIGKEIATYYVDGTAALTVASTAPTSTAPGTWTLNTGSPAVQVTTGKLSGNNKATGGTITAGDAFCVSVTSYKEAAQTNADATWKYTQDGLAKGAC